jgi:hypothetical protein
MSLPVSVPHLPGETPASIQGTGKIEDPFSATVQRDECDYFVLSNCVCFNDVDTGYDGRYIISSQARLQPSISLLVPGIVGNYFHLNRK